jgi:hypothetical protein
MFDRLSIYGYPGPFLPPLELLPDPLILRVPGACAACWPRHPSYEGLQTTITGSGLRQALVTESPVMLPPVRQGSGGMAESSAIRMMHDRIMRRVAIGSATVFAGAVVLWLSGWL